VGAYNAPHTPKLYLSTLFLRRVRGESGGENEGEGKVKGREGRGDEGKDLAHPNLLAWRLYMLRTE